MPVADYFKATVQKAFLEKVSDIHIEPLAEGGVLRFRIDGVLHKIEALDSSFFVSLIAHIKVLADLNVSEKRLPQDGRIVMELASEALDLRVSTLPSSRGECVSIRLLDKGDFLWKTAALGLPEAIAEDIQKLIHLSSGLVVLSGPTGSGKTTTIYSLLSQLNSQESHKILTIEDPVEYSLEGIQQVSVQKDIGLDFANCLRSFLRQDPNILFVGEVRDAETARIAIHAALTGHLVFTTVHTQDSISVVHRLLHLGIDPFLISASLRGVLAQRLLRKLCPVCKTLAKIAPEDLEAIGLKGACLYEAAACPSCSNMGFKGRFAIFEWLAMDSTLKDLINERASHYRFKQYLELSAFKTLQEEAKSALSLGKTSLSEVLKHLQL